MDLIVINGRVETMDDNGTVVRALGIRDGKIAVLGSNSDALAERDKTSIVIDAKERVVLPGFIEPHNHMVGYGTSLLEVDVRTPPNRSIRDIVERLRERASLTREGEWIRGRGYDDTGLEDMRHPNREDLDSISKNHPIAIVHNSGHMLAVNTKALEMTCR